MYLTLFSEAYAALVAQGVAHEHARDLALHTAQQKPWGSERFRREIEALAGRAVEVRRRGRPAKAPGSALREK